MQLLRQKLNYVLLGRVEKLFKSCMYTQMLFAAVDVQVERVKCRVFSMRKLIIWLLNCALVWLLKEVTRKHCNNNFMVFQL